MDYVRPRLSTRRSDRSSASRPACHQTTDATQLDGAVLQVRRQPNRLRRGHQRATLAVHVLTLALGLGAVFARGRALSRPLDDAGWQRLLAADSLWGAAAGLWIASGLARVFYGGKEPAFYLAQRPTLGEARVLILLIFVLEG